MQKTADTPTQNKATKNRPKALISLTDLVPFIAQDPPYGRGISSASFLIGLLIILCLSALAYGSVAFFWAKFSRAEVFFAESAREMLASGNFITPLYHNQPFFDKPILVYWLILAMFKGLGVHHLAARLPSIVASLITITAIAFSGSYLFCRRVGLIAAGMLASAFMYLSFSSLCMSDMFLVMFDTLSLILIYAGIRFADKRGLCLWLASVSMGLAFLTKGPIGIVLPTVSSFIYLALTKQWHLLKRRYILRGALSIMLIALPWFYAAYLYNGLPALEHFFIQENLQRFAGSTYDVHRPFWYTIITFFLGFVPWSILLPSAFLWYSNNLQEAGNKLIGPPVKVSANLHYEEPQEQPALPPLPANKKFSLNVLSLLPFELSAELFLWIWLFVAVGFFCFSRGKCDYYTMPAYPAAAILAAHYVCTRLEKYLPLIKATGITILLATITFAIIVLPELSRLVPVSKYAAIITEAPKDVRVGIDNSLFSWADEILFQSSKDPAILADTQQTNSFVAQSGPFILLMPLNKYNLLSVEQRAKWRVLACDKVTTHSLTPGFLISHAENVLDPVPLVLATNIEESK